MPDAAPVRRTAKSPGETLRRGPLRAAALALLVVSMGCRGSEPPVRTAATLAGDWVMTERDGRPLPNTVRRAQPDGRTCTSVLIRSVLSLRADGSYREETEARHWCDGFPEPDTSSVDLAAGRFELRGPRGDTINLFDADTLEMNRQKGVFSGDEMRLEYSVLSPPRTIRYRYVRVTGGR